APANCPPAPTTSQARPRRRLPALQKGPQLAGLLLSPLAPQGAAPAARLTAPRRYNDAVSIGEEIWGCPAVFTKFARILGPVDIVKGRRRARRRHSRHVRARWALTPRGGLAAGATLMKASSAVRGLLRTP